MKFITFRALGEPRAHSMMRNAKSIVRILLIGAAIATILLLIFLPAAAYLAAIAIPISFVLLVIVTLMEQQSRSIVIRQSGQTEITSEEVDMDGVYAWIYTALAVVGLLALGSFIVAATLTDLASVGIGSAVLFLFSVFVLCPYIPLFVQEFAADERMRVSPQPVRIEGSDEPQDEE